jgi:hypothetical protein
MAAGLEWLDGWEAWEDLMTLVQYGGFGSKRGKRRRKPTNITFKAEIFPHRNF